MADISWPLILTISALAFSCEWVDSTLGMGYGTALTPVLILLGFAPLEIVPAVLLSELVTGLLAGFWHHRVGNVDFRPRFTGSRDLLTQLDALGYVEGVRRLLPRHLKVALLLGGCGLFGSVAAVLVAVNLPKFYLRLYIGLLVLTMGLLILLVGRRPLRFSWRRMTGLGLLAAFNKGLSGGGYGPVVTAGQLLSGVESRHAVGITSLAEGLTCASGVAMYWLWSREAIAWTLALPILVGAVLSVPLSAWTVRIVDAGRLQLLIGLVTLVLGLATLVQLFWG